VQLGLKGISTLYIFLLLPVVNPNLQYHITTAHLVAYFHGVYHTILKYSCIAIGLVHYIANVPRLDTTYGADRMEVVNQAWKSRLGCLDKGMEWFLGGECGNYLRAKTCSVGKDSQLTSRGRRGRPRIDMMKSATNGTVGTCNVMLVRERE